ncbi:hypothetical protein BC941DRAFT_336913, partial [Chlamydoabsidia padenii]
IYTKETIASALTPSSVGTVMQSPSSLDVQFDQWENCLVIISELCSTRWVKQKNFPGTSRLIVRYNYACHRNGSYKPSRSVRTAQKETIKCGCPAKLQAKQLRSAPSVMKFTFTNEHENHVPSAVDEVRTLPLTRSSVNNIDQRLR